MLLNSYGFGDVQSMTEAHVMSIIKVISGVKERVKNHPANPAVNAKSNAQTTRYVSTKKKPKVKK